MFVKNLEEDPAVLEPDHSIGKKRVGGLQLRGRTSLIT